MLLYARPGDGPWGGLSVLEGLMSKRYLSIDIDPTWEDSEEVGTPNAAVILVVPEGVEINLRRLTGEMARIASELIRNRDPAVFRSKTEEEVDVTIVTGGDRQQWWSTKDVELPASKKSRCVGCGAHGGAPCYPECPSQQR